MITLDKTALAQVMSFLGTLLSSGVLAVWVAGRKNHNDDKHEIINQLQEDRKNDRERMDALQRRIDELAEKVRKVEEEKWELAKEKRTLQWEKEELARENETLKAKVANLEQRVETLEKERETWKMKS